MPLWPLFRPGVAGGGTPLLLQPDEPLVGGVYTARQLTEGLYDIERLNEVQRVNISTRVCVF